MINKILIGTITLLLLSSTSFAVQTRYLFKDGSSNYKIYISSKSPESVSKAANELKEYIKKSSGVKLDIVKSKDSPKPPFISLGVNPASKKAGLNTDNLKEAGYKIITKNDNLYILGIDTPDNKYNKFGAKSHGTLNGVHAFLEKKLGIRWLMPGEVGVYIPKINELKFPRINRIDNPAFAKRRIRYLQEKRNDVQKWYKRNKQGSTIQLWHTHAWRKTIPKSLYKKHPDWFPMINGIRPKPSKRYKLETTNQGLVHAYAKRAIKYLKEHPSEFTYSVSPTDGSTGWSESPESKKLYGPSPQKLYNIPATVSKATHPSLTPLILKFYEDEANLIKQSAPNKAVAGYIYSYYIFPPKHRDVTLPDNLYLIVAFSPGYGYRMYRNDTRKAFETIFDGWSKLSKNVGYYGIPNRSNQILGAPTPPALGILQFTYSHLASYGINLEALVYGKPAWGTGAVSNYVMAQLNWNPKADPYKIAHEFYQLAYGPKAGAVMQSLYEGLNTLFKKYKTSHLSSGYKFSNSMLKSIYAKHDKWLVSKYLKAKSLVTGKKQTARLEMFGENLILFQWNLRKRGLIKTNPTAPLYRTDSQISDMITSPDALPALNPSAIKKAKEELKSKTIAPDHVKVTIDKPITNAPKLSPNILRGAVRILLTPLSNGQVTVLPFDVTVRASEVIRFELQSKNGKMIKKGVLKKGKPIIFNGNKNSIYFLDIKDDRSECRLNIKNAAFAIKTWSSESKGGRKNSLHIRNYHSPLYFYVPESMKKFNVALIHSLSPSETSAADIIAPNGETITSLETVTKQTDKAEIKIKGRSGFWTIRLKQPKHGSVDDMYIKLGNNLSPWITTNPMYPLIIQSQK